MSIEVKIEQRLKHTKGIREINQANKIKLEKIRRNAMRGGEIEGADQKWLVRTLLEALSFKDNVYELWIEDDTRTLATGQAPDTEPQVPMATTPDVAEAQEEVSPAEVAEAAEEIADEPEKNPDEFAVPVLEGLDRVHQLLN